MKAPKAVSSFCNNHPSVVFVALLIVTFFFCFFKLADYPIQSWDESRVGVVALNMLDKDDYINYYYGGSLDQQLSKPPLMMWSVAGSMAVLGKNEFALRLPSAVSILLAILVVYGLVSMYSSHASALLTCLVLLTVRGLIGDHVGRTGDTDAMLTLFLIASSYSFLRAHDFEDSKHWLFAGVFLGLAFYTKGTAAALVLPAWILYTLYRKRLTRNFSSIWSWSGLVIFLLFIGSWYMLVQTYGHDYPPTSSKGQDAWDNLIFTDTIARLTQKNMSGDNSPFYFIHFLDTKYNLWNYGFYLLLGMWFWSFYKGQDRLTFHFDRQASLQWFAIFMWLIPALLLTLSVSKRPWYMAPFLPFVAINTIWLIRYWQARINWLWVPVVLLLVFTLTRRAYTISQYSQNLSFWRSHQDTLANANRIVFYGHHPQKLLLYCRFKNDNLHLVRDRSSFSSLKKNDMMIVHRWNWRDTKAKFPSIQPLAQNRDYLITQSE